MKTSDDCVRLLRTIQRQLNGLLKEQRSRDYEIGVLLHEVWSKKLYRGKYKSWTQYVEAELSLSRPYAVKYVSLIEAGFKQKDFERVGMSKLVHVFRVPAEQRPAILAVAHTITREQIIAKVRDIRGICKEPVESLTIVGAAAASIIRLAGSMGVTPQHYVELMVNARFGKKVA